MRIIKHLLIAMLAFTLIGCSKSNVYNGPTVTRVIVNKGEREMFLMHNDRVLKSYTVGLGFAPAGHKSIEGDGRTPEGDYIIDRRNPNSEFHLSIGISYPNAQDVAKALAMGEKPGGDIFIHGRPKKYRKGGQDWTAGCIAITDRQIEQVYKMVRNGTPITINP